jgi:hypothetical protein
VSTNEIAKFIQTALRLIDFLPKSIKNQLGFVAEEIDQNVIFIFEIEINGTVGHSGFLGDLGHGRLVKSLLGKHFYRSFQDPVVLVIFGVPIDFGPPVAISAYQCPLNECSFIIQIQTIYVKTKIRNPV